MSHRLESKRHNVIPFWHGVPKMERKSRDRRPRQKGSRDDPFIHSLTQELAVLAKNFIAEHASRHECPSLLSVHF